MMQAQSQDKATSRLQIADGKRIESQSLCVMEHQESGWRYTLVFAGRLLRLVLMGIGLFSVWTAMRPHLAQTPSLRLVWTRTRTRTLSYPLPVQTQAQGTYITKIDSALVTDLGWIPTGLPRHAELNTTNPWSAQRTATGPLGSPHGKAHHFGDFGKAALEAFWHRWVSSSPYAANAVNDRGITSGINACLFMRG